MVFNNGRRVENSDEDARRAIPDLRKAQRTIALRRISSRASESGTALRPQALGLPARFYDLPRLKRRKGEAEVAHEPHCALEHRSGVYVKLSCCEVRQRLPNWPGRILHPTLKSVASFQSTGMDSSNSPTSCRSCSLRSFRSIVMSTIAEWSPFSRL